MCVSLCAYTCRVPVCLAVSSRARAVGLSVCPCACVYLRVRARAYRRVIVRRRVDVRGKLLERWLINTGH